MSEETVSPPLSGGSLSVSRFWLRVLWLSVAVYWIAMFVGSHTPPPPEPHPAAPSDKLVHFTAFAGLSFLLLSALGTTRVVSRRLSVIVVVVVSLYGAFDELTQPLVGRTRDGYDLLADSVGAVIGVVCLLMLLAFMSKRGSAR